MNKRSLLTDAKLPENCIENVLNIDSAEQAAQRLSRRSQLLGDQLITLSGDRQAAAQSVGGLAQQTPLPFPADQAILS
jgi:hypothetical protein